MAKHILIADDHPICVAALTVAARQADPTLAVDTAASLAEVETRVGTQRYDAVLLDIRLPDGEGFEALASLTARFPRMPVAMVSSSDSAAHMRRAAMLGARGFVSKAAPIDAMQRAVASLLEGETAFPEGFDTRNSQVPADEPLTRLSPAQLRVLRELREGHANKEIGHRLGLAEPTVKHHLSAIFRALGVSNRSQAILALRKFSEDRA